MAVLVKFFAGFIIAGLLGPALYGLRTLFGLVIQYQHFSHAGTFDAMTRQIPLFRGKDEASQAEYTMNVVFGANFGFALFSGAVLLAIGYVLGRLDYAQIYIDFAVFLAFFIVLEKLRVFCNTRLIVDKQAEALSKSRVLHEVLSAVLCISFVYWMGLRGLFVGLIGASAITTIYLMPRIDQKPRMRFSLPLVASLVRIGLPITLVALAFLLLRSVDRIVIAANLSREMLGFFAIGTVISGVIHTTLADVVGAVVFPRIMESMGRDDIEKVKGYFIHVTVMIAYFAPLVIGILLLTIHLPLVYLVPEYATAIVVTRILLVGSFFFVVPTAGALVCFAFQRQTRLLSFALAAVLGNAIFSYAFIRAGYGINGVAVGTNITFFLFGTAVLWSALGQFDASALERVRLLATTYLPMLYASVLLIGIQQIPVPDVQDVGSSVLAACLSAFGFAAAFILIFLPMRRHPSFAGIFNELSSMRRASDKLL